MTSFLRSFASSPGAVAPATPEEKEAAANDPIRAGRVGFLALAIGLGGFLLWAAFAPLDEGVPSSGVVAIDTKRKAVQHLTGGIVKDVLVHEGSQVKEGEPLLRLDEATTKANYDSMRQRYLGMRAVHSRLIAEQTGAATVKFPPDLQAESSEPQVRTLMLTQEQLFASRRAALKADLQAMQEAIEGQQALMTSYQGMIGNRRSQVGYINEELVNTRGLVQEGYAPRNRQLELERMMSEGNASMAELQGNIARAQRSIAELRQRQVSRQQEYRKEVETQLTEVGQSVEADESKYRALKEDLQRIEIRSPATGQVVGLAVQTVGAVVQPGQKLMDIVPHNEPLLLETRVPPHLIDRVRAGLPVDVRFTAFANSPQLVVDGKVVSISGDLLTEPQTNVAYYLARVTLTPEGYKRLGKRTLQPGMPVEVVFRTGERSLLTYLLHPLVKRMAASMKEE